MKKVFGALALVLTLSSGLFANNIGTDATQPGTPERSVGNDNNILRRPCPTFRLPGRCVRHGCEWSNRIGCWDPTSPY